MVKVPATDSEEQAAYPPEVYDKRDKTIKIPLVEDQASKNDDIEKDQWADHIDYKDKVREFHKIREEMKKTRPET